MAVLIVINGESNSGGEALNSDLPPADLAPKPQVTILNNNTLGWEPLQIGVNNLLGHDGLDVDRYHGWELGLADRAATIPTPIYLCKTGQGGSTIQEWNPANTAFANYQRFIQRTNAAKTLLSNSNTSFRPVLWYSQGINNAVAQNPIAISEWKIQTVAHFNRMRQQLPGLEILFTELPSQYPAWNAAISEIVASESRVSFVSTSGASFQDSNHWNTAGMRLIASRLVARTIELLAPTQSQRVRTRVGVNTSPIVLFP